MDVEIDQQDKVKGDEEMDEEGLDQDEQHDENDITTEEAAIPRVCMNPGRPSKREIEEHEATHMPYRSWCPHCVRGRGQASPHPRGKTKPENQLPTIALD